MQLLRPLRRRHASRGPHDASTSGSATTGSGARPCQVKRAEIRRSRNSCRASTSPATRRRSRGTTSRRASASPCARRVAPHDPRGSYSRYAGQLSNGVIGFSNPSGNVGYVEFPLGGPQRRLPRLAQRGQHVGDVPELRRRVQPGSADRGHARPTCIDPDLKRRTPPASVVIGFDRELVANLAMQRQLQLLEHRRLLRRSVGHAVSAFGSGVSR